MSKNQEAEQGYIERYDPIDSIESTHYGEIRARGFSDPLLFSLEALHNQAKLWVEQSKIVERSNRSKVVCLNIARKALFESAYQRGKMGIFIATQRGEMPDMDAALKGIFNEGEES